MNGFMEPMYVFSEWVPPDQTYSIYLSKEHLEQLLAQAVFTAP